MFNRFNRPKQSQPQILISSIPEVREEITEEMKEQKVENAECPITMLVPFFPVQSEDVRHQHNYDGLSVLSHIDGYGTSPWNPDEKVTLQTVGSKYKTNRQLMSAFNKALEKKGYTQNELLAHYKISPELFRYLINLDFHSAFEEATGFLGNIKKIILNDSAFLAIYLAVTFILLYRQMILSEICLDNLALNQTTYDLISEQIREVHRNFPNNTFGPSYCKEMGYRNVSNLTMGYFDGSMIGLGTHEPFFKIITAQMEKVDSLITDKVVKYTLLTCGYLFTAMWRLVADDKMKPHLSMCMFLITLLNIGVARAVRGHYDGILSALSHSTELNTVARACNDGFLRPRLTDGTLPPGLAPAFELPDCRTPFMNTETIRYSLLSAPISFFGAKFAQFCWKKLNPSRPVEEQFKTLRANGFNVQGNG